MSVTVDSLQKMLAEDGVRFFVDPINNAVLAMFGGHFGSYQIVFDTDMDGAFLQIRTLNYAMCPKSSPHYVAVLELLGNLNYTYRSTKFGWDPRDGEVVGYVDFWLEDAVLTIDQLRVNLGTLLRTIDKANFRIRAIMESGTDPGDPSAPPSGASDSGDFTTV